MYTVASLEECIEKYFYLKLWLPAAWKVHGGPCASLRWQKKKKVLSQVSSKHNSIPLLDMTSAVVF